MSMPVADDAAIDALVRGAVKGEHSVVAGRDADELLGELSASGRRGPERMLDFMLRTGPFGDGFGADPDGTSLDDLFERPHGRDFGALVPGFRASCGLRAARSNWRQSRWWPTSRGSKRQRTNSPHAAWCSWVGVTFVATTRGCTT